MSEWENNPTIHSFLHSLIHCISNPPRHTHDLRETLHVVSTPTLVHLAVSTESGPQQIIGRSNAIERKPMRMQGDVNASVNGALAAFQEGLDVPHDGVKKLPFVQHHTVPIAKLLLPEKLPFGQRMLFQQVVRFQD